jgi:hypothetical protein
MFEILFGTYYGLDWAAMTLSFFSAWMIGNKNPSGFVIGTVSGILATICAALAGQFGFVASNIISMAIHIRNWLKWRREETQDNRPG